MLKFGITILILCIAATSVYSQNDTELSAIQQKFQRRKIISKYEIVVGGGLLGNSGAFRDYSKPKFGYSIGIGAYHTFTKSFDLNVRATYDLKGSNVEIVSGDPRSMTKKLTIKSNIYYFTFTLLPTFKIGARKKFSIGAGFNYSLLNGGDVTQLEYQSNGQVTGRSAYGKQGFDSSSDMGICAFGGYSFKVLKNNIGTVQFFFNKSIDDVSDPIDGYQRHKSFMLMFSMQIPN